MRQMAVTGVLALLLLPILPSTPATQRAGAISVGGPAPVPAMNISHAAGVACTAENVRGCRNYFPATLAWAGERLLLATNTESDDLHDAGMTGRVALSSSGGARWAEMAQPLARWQLEDCCLPLTPAAAGISNASELLAFSYALRRRTPTDYTHAYAHAEVLSVAGSRLRQGGLRNVTFRFGNPEFQPSGYHRMGCPQVRKIPLASWPRSWANSSLYGCVPTAMHGPTCIFWDNLTHFSLQSPDTKRCDHGLDSHGGSGLATSGGLGVWDPVASYRGPLPGPHI
jgi:hypothetical protein